MIIYVCRHSLFQLAGGTGQYVFFDFGGVGWGRVGWGCGLLTATLLRSCWHLHTSGTCGSGSGAQGTAETAC